MKKNLSPIPKTASVSELQRNYAEIIADAKRSGEPIYLMKQNKPEVILMSVDSFERLYNGYKAYSDGIDELLAELDDDKKNGRVYPLTNIDDLFK